MSSPEPTPWRWERPGYATQYYGQRSRRYRGTPLTLRPGQTLNDVLLRVPAGGVISGRIYDPYGEPAARVPVEALRFQWANGVAELVTVATELTNDREYRLYGLAPGRYWIATGREAAGKAVSDAATEAPARGAGAKVTVVT